MARTRSQKRAAEARAAPEQEASPTELAEQAGWSAADLERAMVSPQKARRIEATAAMHEVQELFERSRKRKGKRGAPRQPRRVAEDVDEHVAAEVAELLRPSVRPVELEVGPGPVEFDEDMSLSSPEAAARPRSPPASAASARRLFTPRSPRRSRSLSPPGVSPADKPHGALELVSSLPDSAAVRRLSQPRTFKGSARPDHVSLTVSGGVSALGGALRPLGFAWSGAAAAWVATAGSREAGDALERQVRHAAEAQGVPQSQVLVAVSEAAPHSAERRVERAAKASKAWVEPEANWEPFEHVR